MSSIYGAVFLWLLSTILWWSGWREEETPGMPHWAVGVFLAVWPLALLVDFTMTPSLSLNGAWLWTIVSTLALGWRTPSMFRWTAVSAGVLMGLFYILIGRIANSPIALSQYFPSWASAIVMGGLSVLFFRHFSGQVLSITSGLLISGFISTIVLASSNNIPLFIRASEWMEKWWIAVISARLWSIVVIVVVEVARKRMFRVSDERGGEQS